MPWTSGEGAKLQMQKYGTPPNLGVLQLAVAIQGCLASRPSRATDGRLRIRIFQRMTLAIHKD